MATLENKGAYLLVEFVEPYSLKAILSLILQVADRCERDMLNKVLVDLTSIHQRISTLDRYDMGLEVARVFGSRIQVAAVASANLINFMAETVAVNRGAKLKVFSEMAAARQWLGVASAAAASVGADLPGPPLV